MQKMREERCIPRKLAGAHETKHPCSPTSLPLDRMTPPPTWAEFFELLGWGLGGVLLGVTTRLPRDESKDPMLILYNMRRVAKYGGYITGAGFLFNATRVAVSLLK